jgi:hypothetical protein
MLLILQKCRETRLYMHSTVISEKTVHVKVHVHGLY